MYFEEYSSIYSDIIRNTIQIIKLYKMLYKQFIIIFNTNLKT